MINIDIDLFNIENLIYEIRGKQVMLDSDLARLYECSNGTKTINQAVKRNRERFPNDFYFQLTEEESKLFWSQIGTKKIIVETRGGRFKNPYVFTEEGVAMLASILKTSVAEKVSISIMRAFVSMRHYIGNNNNRLSNIESKLLEHDNSIKLLKESFNKFDEKKKISEIYYNGQIFDAYNKILELFNETKNILIIIDSYADNTILDIVKRLNVNVIIITKSNNLLTEQDIDRYNKQYNNLRVIYDNTFHDRYFIIDYGIVYHCGTSINRIGYKTFSINIINDYEIKNIFIDKIKKIIDD